MIIIRIGLLPYDDKIASNLMKDLTNRNALKQENKVLLFHLRRARQCIQLERERIKDQIYSLSLLKLNLVMIVIKFDRIPIMKDQIKSLLLPLMKIKEQIIVLIDQFYISEDKEQDYEAIRSLVCYFKLKFFIVYLDRVQVIDDIFNVVKGFDQLSLLNLSGNDNEDQSIIRNITKELNNLHKNIIINNLYKKKQLKKSKKQERQGNRKKGINTQDLYITSPIQSHQFTLNSQSENVKTDITENIYKSINLHIQQNQSIRQFDFEEYQCQSEPTTKNNQHVSQEIIHTKEQQQKEKSFWSCNLI